MFMFSIIKAVVKSSFSVDFTVIFALVMMKYVTLLPVSILDLSLMQNL